MKASQLVKAIRIARRAGRPVVLWGKPGVGKSSLFEQCAAEDKEQFMVMELPLMESVDLRGIPGEKNGMTHWNPPADLPRKGRGYLCMDDMVQGSVPTMNACTRLILAGKLGEYTLPEGWWVCATANREEDAAGANRMPMQVANRFLHLTMEADAGDWIAWAEAHDIDRRCIGFIKYRPELLHVFDPKSKEKAFASPRSWHFCSDVLKSVDIFSADPNTPKNGGWESDERLEFIAGIIGKGVAGEFVGFLRIMEKLVSVESILLDPMKAELPTDAAISYALVYALADRAERKTLAAIGQYVARLSKEFQLLFWKRVGDKHADLKRSKEYIGWCSENAALI